MRRLVLASHERMAEGVKRTLDFITNGCFDITAICAYTSEQPLHEQIQEVFSKFDDEDEVIIMTDMLSGSVNQALIPYRSDRAYLITGFNLPLALEVLLYPQEQQLNKEELRRLVENARQQLQLVITSGEDMEDDE